MHARTHMHTHTNIHTQMHTHKRTHARALTDPSPIAHSKPCPNTKIVSRFRHRYKITLKMTFSVPARLMPAFFVKCYSTNIVLAKISDGEPVVTAASLRVKVTSKCLEFLLSPILIRVSK